MKNDFKHSDKRMQEKLNGFQMSAPENAWAGIEGAIGGNSSSRKGFFYFWIALLFIGVTGAGILTFNYFNGDSDQTMSKSTAVKTAQKNLAANSDDHLNTPSFDANTSNSQTENQTKDTLVSNNTNRDNLHASNTTPRSTQKSNTSLKKPSTLSVRESAKKPSNILASNGQLGVQSQNLTTNDSNKVLASNINSNTAVKQKKNRLPESHLVGSPTENNETETERSEAASQLSLNALPLRSLQPFPSIAGSRESSFQKVSKMRRGAWSLEAGLDLSSVNYTATGNSGTDFAFLNNSYSRSNGKAGFLRVNYQPLNYLSVNTGLEYGSNSATQDYSTFTTTTTFQYDTVGYYFDSITQQQLPIIDTVSTVSETEQQNQINSSISQVNIPVGIMFHLSVGTRSELGVNLTGLLGIRTKSVGSILLDANGNTAEAMSSYRSVNFTVRTAVRYSYLLNENMTVYAEPYLGFGLNNLSSASLPFTTRFRNSGVRVGFRYNF